jgi:hypothetical protein
MIEDPRNRRKLNWSASLRGRPGLEASLSNSADEEVRAALAIAYGWAEGKLRRVTQQLLASDRSPKVRVNVARTTDYEDLFTALLVDADPDVRRNCAMNPRASRDHMELLITDRAWSVRRGAVALGVRYPDEDQLLRLASDKSAGVRWAVIYNPRSPRAALEKIALDTDETNRAAAIHWLQYGPPYVRSAAEVERSTSATPGVFEPV